MRRPFHQDEAVHDPWVLLCRLAALHPHHGFFIRQRICRPQRASCNQRNEVCTLAISLGLFHLFRFQGRSSQLPRRRPHSRRSCKTETAGAQRFGIVRKRSSDTESKAAEPFT